MKKIDFKSMLIGVLTCACFFLIMGQASNNQNGRYQAIAGSKYEWLYLLDTTNGKACTHISNPENTYKKKNPDVWNRTPYINAISKP